MQRLKNIQELLDTKETEFWYDRNGKNYILTMAAIYRMRFYEVIQLVNLEGLYYKNETPKTGAWAKKGRWGKGAPGSDSYFSMAD